jgi:hypothetical protein
VVVDASVVIKKLYSSLKHGPLGARIVSVGDDLAWGLAGLRTLNLAESQSGAAWTRRVNGCRKASPASAVGAPLQPVHIARSLDSA